MSRAIALLGQARLAASSETIRLLGGASALGFLISAELPPPYHLSVICGRIAITDTPDLVATGLFFPSLLTLTIGWTAMTLAMMPLFVTGPVAHIRRCTLPRRRFWATLLFGVGYSLCWMAAGVVLAPLALLLASILETWAAAILMLGIALCWSASPLAQVARNACHRRQRIGAFGVTADLDCVRQGIVMGLACVGTCWPWMLLPAIAGDAHLAVMTMVILILTIDRVDVPSNPRWQAPPLVKIIAITSQSRTPRT